MPPFSFALGAQAVQAQLEATAGEVWRYASFVLAGIVVPALCGVIYKLARIAWDERMGRIEDRNDSIAQLNAARQTVKERKGESP